jgi:hypothetical protein
VAERETLRHGGLTLITERQPDGRLLVTIDQGGERVGVAWADPAPSDPDADDFRDFVDTWHMGDAWRASLKLMRGGMSNARATELRRGYLSSMGRGHGA